MTRLICLSLALVLSACPDDPKRKLGSTCQNDEQCESGLCHDSRCIDPLADDDSDSLLNGFEVGLGLDPALTDSDLDGKSDPAELGPNLVAIDTDGDGRIDALESAIADADDDCIVDELDEDDENAAPGACGEVYRDCVEVLEAGLGTGTYTLDPDGDGSEPAQTGQCTALASGGWTKLTAAWHAWLEGHADGLRKYLFVGEDGSFVLTPATVALWSWTDAQNLPGTWFYQPAGGPLTSFECGVATDPSAVGFGCFVEAGVTFEPRELALDPAAGRVDACAEGFTGLTGCRVWDVYERPVACAPDTGSMIGDGAFDHTDGPCWQVETFEAGGGGLGGNIYLDTVAAQSGHAPAIRAEPYVSELVSTWYANLEQGDLHLTHAHAYRILFSAKASAPRVLIVQAGGEDGNDLTLSGVALTTDWQLFEVPLRPTQSTLDGFVRFFFGYEGEAHAFIDDVQVIDAGPACDVPAGELIGNGDFDAGLACWSPFAVATEGGRWVSQPSGGVDDSPFMALESYDDSGDTFLLSQLELPVASDHAYRLTVSTKGSDTRELTIALVSNDTAASHLRMFPLSAEWTEHELRFWVDPAESNTAGWTAHFSVSGSGQGTIGFDAVSLVDLGTDGFCGAGDPAFDFGTRCVTTTGDVRPDYVFAETSASAPSVELVNPGGTAPEDVAITTQRVVDEGAWVVAVDLYSDVARSFVLQVTDSGGSPVSQAFTARIGWQRYELPFSTAGGPQTIVLQAGGAAAGSMWIDDLDVFESFR